MHDGGQYSQSAIFKTTTAERRLKRVEEDIVAGARFVYAFEMFDRRDGRR
jgi:hypothetical protein